MLITPDGVADVHVLAICWVCQRERVVTAIATRSRGRACRRCAQIDSLLAAPYAARWLTPLGDALATDDGVLHTRLFPGAGRDAVARAQERHMTRLAAAARRLEEEGVRHLVARYPGASTSRFVRWDAWQDHLPPSAAASVTAYQEYVAEVHTWIDSVEPRVADAAWLTEALLRGEAAP